MNSYACGSDKNPIHYYSSAQVNKTNTKPCDSRNCGNIDNMNKKFYRSTVTPTHINSPADSYIKCTGTSADKYYPVVVDNYKKNDIYACIPRYLNNTIQNVNTTSKQLSKDQCGYKRGTKGTKIGDIPLSENCTSLSFDYGSTQTSSSCNREIHNIKCFNNNNATAKASGNNCVFSCPINWK